MARASAPLTARGQATKRRLLDAAEETFGAVSYERASVTQITRLAGVAQGTFYLYFRDKHAILVELVDDLGHRLRQRIAAAASGLTDRMEIERAGFLAFFEFIDAHRNLYRIVRQAETVDPRAYQRYYRRIAEGYAGGLAQAMDDGQLARLDPEALAYCLMGMGDFLGMRWTLWQGQIPPDHVLDTLFTLIRHGMAAR